MFALLEGAAMNDIAAWFERHNISMAAVLATLGLLIGAFVFSYLVKRPLQASLRQLASRLSLPYETVLTITRVLLGALWVVVATLVLDIWGVGVGGVWTLLVSAATVIGVGFLATWTMVSNITASFFIAFWRPFHLGDDIEILPENLKGRVIDSNLMYVVARESSGAVIQIPNNLFFQKMFRVTSTSSERTLFEQYEHHSDVARRSRSVSASDKEGALPTSNEMAPRGAVSSRPISN
jgi:small-conductance mechanosensitive channel